jgi:hypothetical protein
MPVLLKCLFTKQMKRQYSMLEKIFFTSMHVQNLKQEKKIRLIISSILSIRKKPQSKQQPP